MAMCLPSSPYAIRRTRHRRKQTNEQRRGFDARGSAMEWDDINKKRGKTKKDVPLLGSEG